MESAALATTCGGTAVTAVAAGETPPTADLLADQVVKGASDGAPRVVTIPRCLLPACETAADLLQCNPLPAFDKTRYAAKKKLIAAASKRLVGDMYGLPFPQTPEEMFEKAEFGCGWLTKAFHRAGTLQESNSVKRIVSWRRFEGGGSGPKAEFELEYERPDGPLDTRLFVKMPFPLEENEGQRWLQEGKGTFGDNFGGEVLFYRYLSPHTPFPTPKFYFGDVCRESTEAILINARVDWPERGTTEFSNNEVFPPCGKCEDYLLTNPEDYYFAVVRRLGTFSGLAKAGKLGPENATLNWFNCGPTNDVNCMPGLQCELGAKAFIEQVAPHWFPARARTSAFLSNFVAKFQDFDQSQDSGRVAQFLYADPLYVGLHHQNGNSDNCYFYRDSTGKINAGVLDWGSTAPMSYASGLMGTTIGAQAEMLAAHDEGMVRAWADAYNAAGAPRMDVAELLLRYRLATCINAYCIFGTVDRMRLRDAAAMFKTLPAYNCEEIRKDFGTRFNMSMLYNRILLFILKGDYYWSALPEMLKRRGSR